MKIRIGLAALAAGALALGLVVPGAATAAPDVTPKAEKPSGKALVRIDTGVAITKEQSKGSYRIVVPTGAFIGWMGEVSGKGPRVGNFSPKALVGAWATLGHSDSNRATATLTWVKKGETKPTFVAATLEKPRISDAGKLTFIAKVERKLPKNMNGFTININRAAPTVRYPIPGAILYLDAYHQAQGYQTTESGDGYVAWTGTDGSRSECSEQTDFSGPGTYPIAEDIVCAGLIISHVLADGTQSTVEVTEDGQVNVSTAYGYEDGATTQGAEPRQGVLLTFFALMMTLF